MSEFNISSAFLVAYRQHAGETPAIRWSRLHFRIAGASGSQTFRLVFFRFAGETPASQDRGHLACKRLYSTANERGLISQQPFWLPIGNMQARRPRSFGLWIALKTIHKLCRLERFF
ncbi:MAG: hypothetical protein LBP59_06705 [Planctomycetaceae bacterium]|jgi:hypothetical protein|nr:hypothetical protein [Planctomycetaceae bacterium]